MPNLVNISWTTRSREHKENIRQHSLALNGGKGTSPSRSSHRVCIGPPEQPQAGQPQPRRLPVTQLPPLARWGSSRSVARGEKCV